MKKKKVLKDVSRLLNGKPKRKKINFMTTHRELYAGLKNEEHLSKMLLVEKNLSRRAFYIIDRDKVARMQSAIQQGDIIAFATDQEGLDVAHVGFAVKAGQTPSFASRIKQRRRRGYLKRDASGLPEVQ